MISFILFFLYATAFSAALPNVKRDSDAFTVLTRAISSVNNAITNASNALSGMSAQDGNNIDPFMLRMIDLSNIMDDIEPGVLNATMNRTSLKDMDDTQVQQLSEQSAMYGNNIINLVHSVLGKKNIFVKDQVQSIVQGNLFDVEGNVAVLLCPIISVSPQPGDAALNMTRILANLNLVQTLTE